MQKLFYRKKNKAAFNIFVILTILTSSCLFSPSSVNGEVSPFFTLVAKTSSGGVWPDYLNLLKQQVAEIGINVEVIIRPWPTFVYELILYRDFDICYVSLQGGGADPDFTGVYNENGSLNLFGYHTSMDYNETLGTGVNEWYMKQGNLIMPPDSEERIQHYWAWEQYLMDKILPCQPTFAPKSYVATWANLDGYNISDGILQSWGKMYFNGTHNGQLSTTELVINDAAWSDLNPLFQDDSSSSFISSATMDPLIWFDADTKPWPHLAKNWTYLNDTHLRFHLREGIKWQTDPEGIFTNEYFDAEDVYFTLHNWMFISSDLGPWAWLKNVEVIDKYTIDFFVDGNEDTPENDPYSPALTSLALRILPEHYLNQTQLADGTTPDKTDPAWGKFANHCFGTGILEFTSFTEGVETTLQVFDDCWRMNQTITADSALNWAERFGEQWELEQLRVKIISDSERGLAEFEAGSLDLIGVTNNPSKREQYSSDPDFDVQSDTQFYLGFFGYNMRESRGNPIGSMDPCPNDPGMTVGLAVRKAISYAMDREAMNAVVNRGEYTITDHPIYSKQAIWCNPDIIRYDHNLVKAREYMVKAGYNISLEEPVTIFSIPTLENSLSLGVLVILSSLAIGWFSIRKKSKKNYFSN